VTESELRDALDEFAKDVLGSEHPDAKAGVSVIEVRRPFEWPTTENGEPVDPRFNAVATLLTRNHEHCAQILEAMRSRGYVVDRLH
jgi:hypothetical protein